MTFALATATILSIIWGFVVLASHVLEHSGDKILAALKGKAGADVLATKPVLLRHRLRSDMPLRASAKALPGYLRVAA